MLLGHNWVTNGSFFERQVHYKSDIGINDYTALESGRKWVFMGWIYEFSGMKEVAESISTTDNEKIKLMIVGEGDLYEPLLKMKSEKNLDGRLILTGKVPFADIPKYLAAADICLLPAYKNEIMMNIVPIKIYEYMA
ncbi:MAG: glycosyltransferase [Methanosarcinales archaeon]|nr:MAG: glycosyltransferase [Methanosarcinales archaeon]